MNAESFDAGNGIEPLAAIVRDLRDAGGLFERSPVSDISRVRTLCGSKPGLTWRSATKVRMSSAAPISRTRARETSLITSRERALLWRNPVPERLLLSLRVVLRSGREAPMAGKRPKRMPVSSEMPSVKSEYAPVEADGGAMFADAGKAGGTDGQQRAHANVAEHEAEDAAGDGKHHAFGEQLADDAGAAGTHGGADGEFALAAGGAHEQEIGDVGAGDEQHEADRAEKDQQRLARAGNDGVAQRLHAEAVFGSHVVRVAAAVLVGGQFELGIGLGKGHAGFQPAGGQEVVAVIGAVGIDLEGNPDIGFGVGDEGFSQDADDGVGLIAQRERGPTILGLPPNLRCQKP